MLQGCNRVLDVHCFGIELADKQCAGVRRRFSPIGLFYCQGTVSHVQKENCKALRNAAYYWDLGSGSLMRSAFAPFRLLKICPVALWVSYVAIYVREITLKASHYRNKPSFPVSIVSKIRHNASK